MKEINEATWFAEVTCSSTPVAVHFYAEWSPACRDIECLLEEYEQRFAGKLKFVKIDIDSNEAVRIANRIIAPPSLIIYYKGIPVNGIAGPQPPWVYENRITRAIRLYERRLKNKNANRRR
ncbi:thioredoxin family protein [Candidatus Pyrohabitans sp.]